jgi:pilus assembly protein CpaF
LPTLYERIRQKQAEQAAHPSGPAGQAPAPPAPHGAAVPVGQVVLPRRMQQAEPSRRPPGEEQRHEESLRDEQREERRRLLLKVQQRLLLELDTKLLTATQQLTDAQKAEIRSKIMTALASEEGVPPLERDAMADALLAEIAGYGPIQPLLDDPEVNEVMVNSPTLVYVEKKGKLTLADVRFVDDRHVLHVIEKIVAPLGRRIDEASPMVDARLPDGSRVNAVIPPLALKGPSLTIRKFSRKPIMIEQLVEWGTLTKPMALFLEGAIRARANVVVSGGTGSGKTTTLNILSGFIPDDERIVTIEDAAELQLRQQHVVSLETRPPNIEGRGEISIRHLVRNALRMRPDRIVVGECRGGEALDMLQAMNTGHDGSLTTGHANTPRDMIARLETMVMMAGIDLPVRAIREQIASAVDLIVQVARLKDGTRRITHVTEVQGMEGDVVVLQDIFLFKQTGLTPDGKMAGRHAPTGIRPRLYERLLEYGLDLPDEVFEAG